MPDPVIALMAGTVITPMANPMIGLTAGIVFIPMANPMIGLTAGSVIAPVAGRASAALPVGDGRLVLACFGNAPAEHPSNHAPPAQPHGAFPPSPTVNIPFHAPSPAPAP
jgi:hypothetical protein